MMYAVSADQSVFFLNCVHNLIYAVQCIVYNQKFGLQISLKKDQLVMEFHFGVLFIFFVGKKYVYNFGEKVRRTATTKKSDSITHLK